jgi:hypothetical protein
VAYNLGVSERSVLTAHIGAFDPVAIASMLQEAQQLRVDEVSSTSHAILSLAAAGRVLGSLGQAVRFVSRNHNRLTGPNKWECVGILDGAGDATSAIGVALSRIDDSTDVILLSDEAVVLARQALQGAIDKLSSGWTMFEDRPDIDAIVLEGMRSDLTHLPQPTEPAGHS